MTVQHIVAKTGDKTEVILTVESGSSNDACGALFQYFAKNGFDPATKYCINGEHVEVFASFRFKLGYGRNWPEDEELK